MKKIILTTLVILSVFAFPWTKALAEDKFKIESEIFYSLNLDMTTTVKQKVKIRNLYKDIIATNYTISLQNIEIYDLELTGKNEDIKINTSKEDNLTKIHIIFEKPALGKNALSEFEISYKTKSLLFKTGNVYMLNIPGNENPNYFSKYSVVINTPLDFGPLLFVSPGAQKIEQGDKARILSFDKETLGTNGISASFGEFQSINFNITYEIENPTVLPGYFEIALPSDKKNYQQVKLSSISKQPVEIYEDHDGNFMAKFFLLPFQKNEIELKGAVKLFGMTINDSSGGELKDIPESLKVYTKKDQFWNKESSEIIALKNKIYDPELTVLENERNLYEYLVKNLKYDYEGSKSETIERRGSVFPLQNQGLGACMEFTDLFIATSRAMGIPAREINGYPLNIDSAINKPLSINFSSGDVLHAWPEFYDPKFGWIQVDPTWGNTSGLDYFSKLDTNRITLVTKGLSSTYPIPAGAYKNNLSKKLIEADFAESDTSIEFIPEVTIKEFILQNPIDLILKRKVFEITNNKGVTVYNIMGEKLLPFEKRKFTLKDDENYLELKYFKDQSVKKPIIVEKDKILFDENIITKLLLTFVLGLGLYILFSLLIKKSARLQRLFLRLFSHLPGQDQPHSHNLK